MVRGDGSISQRSKGVYLVQVCYPKDPVTGEVKRASRVVRGTKADAKKARDEMLRERDAGVVLDGSNMTFAEFAALYLETLKASGEVYLTTYSRRETRLRCISKYIGNMKLRDITSQVVDSTMAAVKSDKVAARGSFSNTTLRNYFEDLSLVFQKALDYDYITRNPCDKARKIKQPKVKRGSLTETEGAKLLRMVDDREEEAYARIEGVEIARERLGRTEWPRERIQFLSLVTFAIVVRLGLATGVRLGEALGLLWDCVDLENGAITVMRALDELEMLKEPKTPAGIRTVSIDAKTVWHLARWKREQAEILSRIGVEQTKQTPVACNGYGQLYDRGMFWRQFREFREEAGFPGLKFHELRHTHASILIGNGVDVKTVQKRLGHSRAAFTLDVYGHALPQNDKKAADLIGNLFDVEKALDSD